MVVVNDSQTLIEETYEFDRLENFEIVQTDQLKQFNRMPRKTRFDVECAPGQAVVILLKRQSEKAAEMHFTSAVKPP